jgi:hypothetical protein
MIVSLSGVKFSGKDTVAEGLIRSHGFKRIGLADKLKDICAEVFDIERLHMDIPELKEVPLVSPREISITRIDHLLRTIARDGFEFDYEKTFTEVCKNFQGKNLTSIRDVLQTIGTDVCRAYIKDDIWLAYVHDRIKNTNDNIVITDARFANERSFLLELGAVLILVKRPNFESGGSHISENQLGLEEDYDVVINNASTITAVQSDIALWYTLVKDAATSYKSRIK